MRAKTGDYALEFCFAPAGGQNEDAWSERRFELGAAYEDLWIKYDLYIPANYYHRTPADQVTNNKGLIMLWSDEYFANQHMSLHFFPSEANPGGSVMYGNYSVNTEEEGMQSYN